METKNNIEVEKNFHAVEFMREVRSEMTDQFLHDKQKYLDHLKEAMEEFKIRQKRVYQ